MAIIRRLTFEDNFTRYHNEMFDVLKGDSDALALHLYLMSKPDDWRIMTRDVEKQMGWGREKRQNVMKRLQDVGLMEYKRNPTQGSEWLIYDSLILREPEKPVTERPVHIVTTETSLTTERETKPLRDDGFEKFWGLYTKKKSKGAAQRAWNKLSPKQRELATEDVLTRVYRDPDWIKDQGKYIPYPATYLNAHGWEDEIETDNEANDEANRWV